MGEGYNNVYSLPPTTSHPENSGVKNKLFHSIPFNWFEFMEAGRTLIHFTLRSLNRIIILSLLSRASLSGYRVTKEMRRITGRKYNVGVIYPILYQLEGDGLILGEWVEQGRRRIKKYSITEKGRRLLQEVREFFKGPIREILLDLLGNESSE
ncbi:hypothetical protein DRO56_02100 [Candidatus Bathyarchaeota archaeon]|nr:MAG: hypothetical protein DRO56_02100 [Candidatus Bathyarchaeota archaeon]